MSNISQSNAVLAKATTVHVVGSKPRELRPATKAISALIKVGLLAGVAVVGWKTVAPSLTHSSAPVEASAKAKPVLRTEQSKTPGGEVLQLPAVVAEVPQTALQNLPNANAPKLVIDVKHTDTTPALAVKMWRAGQEFQAAALQAEGLELQPYYIEGDKTQPTIGVGYNIKMSVNTIGASAVRSELAQAGIDGSTVQQLMSPQQAISSQAKITVPQALALLDVATHRFRASTRAAIGADVFDKLPAHRQASLMWIDYNSNIHKRPDLVNAVRANQTHTVIDEMETWITVHGKKIRSPNTVLAQAMYWSKEGMQQVVMNPSKIKRDAANDIVMWQSPPPVTGANIHVTAGTAQRVPALQEQAPAPVVPAPVQAPALAHLSNVNVVAPPSEQPQPSSSATQTTPETRRNWLNARNVRAVDTPEPAAPSPTP